MMKKPKVEKINLPYASSVASFYGDQGAAQGNSFLGRMFQGTGRTIVNKVFQGGAEAPSTLPGSGMFNNGGRK